MQFNPKQTNKLWGEKKSTSTLERFFSLLLVGEKKLHILNVLTNRRLRCHVCHVTQGLAPHLVVVIYVPTLLTSARL